MGTPKKNRKYTTEIPEAHRGKHEIRKKCYVPFFPSQTHTESNTSQKFRAELLYSVAYARKEHPPHAPRRPVRRRHCEGGRHCQGGWQIFPSPLGGKYDLNKKQLLPAFVEYSIMIGKENNEWKHDPLTHQVIAAAIEVHRKLGPGLLESVYERCLAHELHHSGISFVAQSPLPIFYKGVGLDCGYRADILVEDCLILELKAVEKFSPLHEAQLLTYMKLAKTPIGLLINFNVTSLRQGIRRFVL